MLDGKRSAEIVRTPAATLVDIRPIGTHIVRAKTKAAVLREVGRLQKRGYVYSASELVQFHSRAGGGYGVKLALIKRLPEPMPGWAKGCALVGGVLCVLSGFTILLLNAAADLARSIPWGLVIGGIVVVAVALLIVRRVLFGGGISITQNVTFK